MNTKLSYNFNKQKKKQFKQKERKTQRYLVQPTVQQAHKNQFWENTHQIN